MSNGVKTQAFFNKIKKRRYAMVEFIESCHHKY